MILAPLRANIAATIFGGLAAILLAICLYQSVQLNGFLWWDGAKDKAAKYDTAIQKLVEERRGRKVDRDAYIEAQRKAKELNAAEVARIKAEQEKVNAEAKSRYQRDLRRLRAGGLRKDLAAPQGSAGCATASADGKAASGTDEQNVCVSRSLLMRAAEIELARNALIDWINNQLGVKR